MPAILIIIQNVVRSKACPLLTLSLHHGICDSMRPHPKSKTLLSTKSGEKKSKQNNKQKAYINYFIK